MTLSTDFFISLFMLWLLSCIILLPLVFYTIQSERWRITWLKTPNAKYQDEDKAPFLSVIIPFRNEKDNLPVLITSLAQQTYKNWELILIDDHSNDKGFNLIEDVLYQFPVKVNAYKNLGEGKKQALATGTQAAIGEFIVTSDCDCTFEKDWLKTIAFTFAKDSPDLIIAPVRQLHDKKTISDFQVSEFIALQVSGGAAAINQKAIMLNGANLACRKDVYMQSDLRNSIDSGDDMFLLEFLKDRNKKVHFLKSRDAMVYTPTEPTLHKLLKQKARWASKAKNYIDDDILKSGLVVTTTNLVQLILYIQLFLHPIFIYLFVISFIIRLIVDMRLINAGKHFFTYQPCLRKMIMYQLLYPLYVLVVVLYPVIKPLDWKGRKIKS